MKFFTPELIAQLNSTDDAVADAADAAWDAAVDRHDDQLQALRPQLPAGLLSLLEGYFLHDASVLSMGQQGQTFVLVLRLDVPPHELLILTYQLAAEPRINREALYPETRCNYIQWLYDEVSWTAGDPGYATHNILFSNGWEVELHLRDVQVTAAQTLIPVPTSPPVPNLPATV